MKTRWIEIPFFALSKSSNLTETQQALKEKQTQNVLSQGVPQDILCYAQGIFEKYYSGHAIFQIRKKRLLKEPLNELELKILEDCEGFKTIRGGGEYHCFYNGVELIWRIQAWNNEADSSLPYQMRNKSKIRHM